MTTNYGGFSGFSGTTSEDVLTSDGEEESVGLTGQVYNVKGCTDPDASSQGYDLNQLKVASTVTSTSSGSKADKCINKVVKGKTIAYLYEGICMMSGKPNYWQKDCSVIFGSAYKCVDGACVDTTPKPVTCTPGPTGKGKCVKSSINQDYYYQKEYQNSDCTTYLTNQDQKWCGYSASYSTCQDNIGCCKFEGMDNECKENIIYYPQKNSCTGEITTSSSDCSKYKDTTGLPMTCFYYNDYYNKKNFFCGSSCNDGNIGYVCNTTYVPPKYQQHSCQSDGTWAKWKGTQITEPTCPTGATCYNPEGKCA